MKLINKLLNIIQAKIVISCIAGNKAKKTGSLKEKINQMLFDLELKDTLQDGILILNIKTQAEKTAKFIEAVNEIGNEKKYLTFLEYNEDTGDLMFHINMSMMQDRPVQDRPVQDRPVQLNIK